MEKEIAVDVNNFVFLAEQYRQSIEASQEIQWQWGIMGIGNVKLLWCASMRVCFGNMCDWMTKYECIGHERLMYNKASSTKDRTCIITVCAGSLKASGQHMLVSHIHMADIVLFVHTIYLTILCLWCLLV